MNETFQHWYFNQTVLHPLGLVAILVLGTTMLLVPRRYAVLPMMVMACFIAPAQRIALFSLNFDLLRIMVLFGTARILLRGELRGFRWSAIDSALLAWALTGTVAYIVLWASGDAVKYKLGELYDVIGMYFLFRCLVRDWADIQQIIFGFILLSIPVAAAFLIEHFTAHNMFSVLGGVPAITAIREGRLRCQGAFSHPITAGCFWAALIPLMAVYWYKRDTGPRWAVVGTLCAGFIVIATASATPLTAVMAGFFALALFPLRHSMRLLRWCLLGILILLHLVMKAPVWHLVARIDIVGGATGWHRFNLIDNTIHHFSDWFLIGTRSTAEWGAGLQDITNQYVFEAVRGGLLTLLLFVLLIALAFRAVGRLWRRAGDHRNRVYVCWAIGASLFVHTINFLGVSYFGQITMIWLLHLALIASLDALPPRCGRRVRTARAHGRLAVIWARRSRLPVPVMN